MRKPRNACGQTVAALLLRHWKADPHATTQSVHATHPPDTPLALLGTTPWGLERTLRAHGLDARRRARDEHPREWLEASLELGPTPLCVDLRHLGYRWPALHWIVATHADHERVRCANLVRTRYRASEADVPWSELMRAWRCRAMPVPAYRWAGVRVRGGLAAPG